MLALVFIMIVAVGQLSLSALKELSPVKGEYLLYGYVSNIYTCPPCPPGAQCEPCTGNHIVLSEKKRVLESYQVDKDEVVIFVKNPKVFKLGKRYLCRVKVLADRTTASGTNDLELIDSKPLK